MRMSTDAVRMKLNVAHLRFRIMMQKHKHGEPGDSYLPEPICNAVAGRLKIELVLCVFFFRLLVKLIVIQCVHTARLWKWTPTHTKELVYVVKPHLALERIKTNKMRDH